RVPVPGGARRRAGAVGGLPARAGAPLPGGGRGRAHRLRVRGQERRGPRRRRGRRGRRRQRGRQPRRGRRDHGGPRAGLRAADLPGGRPVDPAERRGVPMASPLLAGDLSGFPPTYLVTAGFDPLRDEGEEFAKRLEEAGVPVALRRQQDLIHAFANMWSLGGRFQEAMSEAAGALRTGLYAGPRRRSSSGMPVRTMTFSTV